MDIELLRHDNRRMLFQQRSRLFMLLRTKKLGSSDPASAFARSNHTSTCAFADQTALELRERRQHVKRETPTGRPRINVFRKRDKANLLRVPVVDYRRKISERTPQAIKPPDDECAVRTKRV
jgi:hypothetical protein